MPRILVADPDKLVRWSLARVLSGDGYEVVTVESAALLLEETSRGTVDVVLMDHLSSQPSGIELLRKIKTSTPKTHVILITGSSWPGLERLARDIGAFDYFEKPFEVKTVTGSVARALATPERRRGPRA